MTVGIAVVEVCFMGFLVVDLNRVLDDSSIGRAAARQLQQRFDAARAAVEKLASRGSSPHGRARSGDAAAELEASERAGLEAERSRLRAEVLARVRPIIEAVAKDRSADVVLDAAAVIACVSAVDVTDEVLRRLDDQGAR